MKRLCVLILALALAVFMTAPAFATWTRVVTMGNQVVYGQDDYNIWGFTSTVNNYPRHLIIDHSVSASDLEFGLTESINGGTRLGMIVPFMKNMVLGAFISDFSQDYGSFTPGGGGSPITDGFADQKIDLFWGYRASNFDLGVRIDWYGEGVEIGGTQSEGALGLNAGLGFNLSGNMLEANVMYRSLSFTNETFGATPVPITEKDGGSDLGLNARYLIAYNSMVTLVPAFQYRSQKIGYTVPAPSTEAAQSTTTGWDLGIGCNTVPLQGTEFLTSIGVRSFSAKVDSSGTDTLDASDSHMPYIAFGTEIQVKNWLQFRFGAEKTWDSIKDNLSNPEAKAWAASFDYMVGAGIMVGDLQFDVEVNPGWFNAGPYLLSGESDGDMFGWISIKYDYR